MKSAFLFVALVIAALVAAPQAQACHGLQLNLAGDYCYGQLAFVDQPQKIVVQQQVVRQRFVQPQRVIIQRQVVRPQRLEIRQRGLFGNRLELRVR